MKQLPESKVKAFRKYRKGKGARFQNPPISTYYLLKSRCESKKNPAYKDYGGRGIKCIWKSSKHFIDEMGSSWKKGLTLDRIDVNGNYCKENCRWVSMKVQANNKRNNVLVTFNGETKTLHEWSDYAGIKYATFYQRFRIRGLPMELCMEKTLYARNRIPITSSR